MKKPKSKAGTSRNVSTNKTARRKRMDLSQSRPKFNPVVLGWGLGTEDASSTEWEKVRTRHGQYLHPLLLSWVTALQDDYASNDFPTGTQVTISIDVTSAFERYLGKYGLTSHDEHARQRIERICKRKEGDLAMLVRSMIAAVAGKDIEFFRHLISILEDNRSQSLPASTSRKLSRAQQAVLRAHGMLVNDARMGEVVRRRPDLAGAPRWRKLVLMLDPHFPREFPPFHWQQFDKKILGKKFSDLVPKWKDIKTPNRQREIERRCQILGIPLLKKPTP
ncbi:hypothetical protein [Roseimicrobium sp. ORNL1]|uniref:hypothetical protein n=1 Tax=Roseimicrobium sp. ORNL1 TaxID=2711231 RepID=UPI0013E1A72F|nr:hypothetical protein [Roseimicrobium sp. ORNL1]QIF02438.1 hypothetical protein G5S37_13190 [Roseimicrobium sp. ORNL1]